MAGTFAHNLQTSVYHVYHSDDNTDYLVKLEPKYTAASGLTVATTQNIADMKRYPNQKRARHTYIHATEDAPVAGHIHRRKVICATAILTTPGTIGTIDGLTAWSYGGFIGEKIRK